MKRGARGDDCSSGFYHVLLYSLLVIEGYINARLGCGTDSVISCDVGKKQYGKVRAFLE